MDNKLPVIPFLSSDTFDEWWEHSFTRVQRKLKRSTYELECAVRFMKDRGYEFNSEQVLWTSPNPEHWQPTEAEVQTAVFIDRETIDWPYSKLEKFLKDA